MAFPGSRSLLPPPAPSQQSLDLSKAIVSVAALGCQEVGCRTRGHWGQGLHFCLCSSTRMLYPGKEQPHACHQPGQAEGPTASTSSSFCSHRATPAGSGTSSLSLSTISSAGDNPACSESTPLPRLSSAVCNVPPWSQRPATLLAPLSSLHNSLTLGRLLPFLSAASRPSSPSPSPLCEDPGGSRSIAPQTLSYEPCEAFMPPETGSSHCLFSPLIPRSSLNFFLPLQKCLGFLLSLNMELHSYEGDVI